jgi:hypothetical protein
MGDRPGRDSPRAAQRPGLVDCPGSVASIEPGVEDAGRVVDSVDAADRGEGLAAGVGPGPAQRLQRRERELGLLDGQPGLGA